MCEDGKGAAEKGNKVHQVVTGLPSGLSGHPVIISQLQKLVDLLVQVGVDFFLCSMAGIL